MSVASIGYDIFDFDTISIRYWRNIATSISKHRPLTS